MKRSRAHPYTYGMVCVVILATLFRLLLIAFNWPVTNSDEGNMGVIGLHVAFNGEWPVFFYGLPYMGPAEGYLAAPIFKIFGASLFTLRLPLVFLYTGFLIGTYYLVGLLYNEKYALISTIVLSLGSPEMIMRQLKAVGEYPEMAIGAALMPLIAAWLVLSAQTLDREQIRQRWLKRAVLFGLLGLIMGISIWIDFLILPFVGAAGLLLLLFCWREIRGWIALVIGGVIGAFPLLYHNVTAPFEQNSFNVLLWLHQIGNEEMIAQGLTGWHKLIGTVMIALPLQTGAYPRPPDEAWPVFGTPTMTSTLYAVYFTLWGLTFLVLLVIATVLSILAIKRQLLPLVGKDAQQRLSFARDCARFMLLLSACLTLVQYMTSSHGAVYPITSARYLTCLLNVMPAIFWPVWTSAGQLMQATHLRQRVKGITSYAILGILIAVYLFGTVATTLDVPRAYASYQQQDRLVQRLLSLGATRVYSEYWTCNNLTFHSQEKIICSAVTEKLEPGFDRYLPYRESVNKASDPAYVFPKDMQHVNQVEQQLKDKQYARHDFEDYIIFQAQSQEQKAEVSSKEMYE